MRRPLHAVALATLAALPLAGWAALSDPIRMSAGTITIEGTSNVHGWTCTSTNFTLSGEGDVDTGEIEEIRTLTVTVPTAQIECRNGTMNRLMREALRTPTIAFALTRATVGDTQSGRFPVTAAGNLTIAGRTRPVTLTAEGRTLANGRRFRVTGSTPITMSQYGVRPPRAMAGTMRVRDNVTVRFDVTLTR